MFLRLGAFLYRRIFRGRERQEGGPRFLLRNLALLVQLHGIAYCSRHIGAVD